MFQDNNYVLYFMQKYQVQPLWRVIRLIFLKEEKDVVYLCNVAQAQFSIQLFNIAMSEVKNKANQSKTKKIKKQGTQEHDQQVQKVKSNKSAGKQDSRFAKASYDPKFMAPSQKITKVKIDKRFNKMMNDPAFQNQSTIDRYGRKVNPKDVNNELKEYYYMEDEKPEVEEEHSQQENEQSSEIEEEKQGITEWMENYDEESSELSDVPLDFDEEDIDRVWDDESEHVIKGEDVVATKRLALCNYDWMNISSKDLMLLFSSFKTSSGFIKSVKVYMSNIGKEKLQLEEKYGPQGIWRDVPEEQRETKTKDWKKSWKQLLQQRQDDNNAFDEKKLRQYQKQRLKYFYAVIECDSARAADQIYKECDGNQFQNSNLPFDLRFIPDEIEFYPSNLKEECKDVPVGGQVKNFITKALGHSKVSLSWQDPQLSVAASLKRKNWNKMSQKELDNVDWSMYINTQEADKQDGMKKLVNEGIKDQEFVSDWKKSCNKKYRKQDDDIEIAFEGGFDTKNKNKKRGKVVEDEEEEAQPEKKQRKSMKERRREHEQQKAKRREQLELLVEDNKKTDFNINLNDQRFKAVYENPFYSIDPVDSRFDHRKSGKVFAEVVRRNKDKSQK